MKNLRKKINSFYQWMKIKFGLNTIMFDMHVQQVLELVHNGSIEITGGKSKAFYFGMFGGASIEDYRTRTITAPLNNKKAIYKIIDRTQGWGASNYTYYFQLVGYVGEPPIADISFSDYWNNYILPTLSRTEERNKVAEVLEKNKKHMTKICEESLPNTELPPELYRMLRKTTK